MRIGCFSVLLFRNQFVYSCRLFFHNSFLGDAPLQVKNHNLTQDPERAYFEKLLHHFSLGINLHCNRAIDCKRYGR